MARSTLTSGYWSGITVRPVWGAPAGDELGSTPMSAAQAAARSRRQRPKLEGKLQTAWVHAQCAVVCLAARPRRSPCGQADVARCHASRHTGACPSAALQDRRSHMGIQTGPPKHDPPRSVRLSRGRDLEAAKVRPAAAIRLTAGISPSEEILHPLA
eukprot:365014-Chlamydomonas_euryale.AAC.3